MRNKIYFILNLVIRNKDCYLVIKEIEILDIYFKFYINILNKYYLI